MNNTDMTLTLTVNYMQMEKMEKLQRRLRTAGLDWTIQQVFEFAMYHGSSMWLDKKLEWAEEQINAYINPQ